MYPSKVISAIQYNNKKTQLISQAKRVQVYRAWPWYLENRTGGGWAFSNCHSLIREKIANLSVE